MAVETHIIEGMNPMAASFRTEPAVRDAGKPFPFVASYQLLYLVIILLDCILQTHAERNQILHSWSDSDDDKGQLVSRTPPMIEV